MANDWLGQPSEPSNPQSQTATPHNPTPASSQTMTFDEAVAWGIREAVRAEAEAQFVPDPDQLYAGIERRVSPLLQAAQQVTRVRAAAAWLGEDDPRIIERVVNRRLQGGSGMRPGETEGIGG